MLNCINWFDRRNIIMSLLEHLRVVTREMQGHGCFVVMKPWLVCGVRNAMIAGRGLQGRKGGL